MGKKQMHHKKNQMLFNYKGQRWLSLYCGIRNYLKLVKSSASNWLGVNIEATGTTLYKMHYQKIAIKSISLSSYYINVNTFCIKKITGKEKIQD